MDLIPVSFDFFGEFWVPKNLTVAKLRTTLSRTTHIAQIENLYVGAICLDDHHRVGQEPLVSGAHLSSTRSAQPSGTSGSATWRVAHLTTGQVLPLSSPLPELETKVSKGKVKVKLRPGWKTVDRSRLRFWEPGQTIRVRSVSAEQNSAAQVVSYQLRGPVASKPSVLSRLKQIPAARLIPAGMSMAMAIGIALILHRPWIMLMGLSFPLVILATALGSPSASIGAESGPAPRGALGLPEPKYALATATDRFTGPHPCDLADHKPPLLEGRGSALPIIAIIGPQALAIRFARAVIVGRASTALSCEPVPKHSFGTGVDEPWMRWLAGGTMWARSVLVLEPGSPVPSWCSVTATVSGGLVTLHHEGAVIAQTGYYGITAPRAEILARSIAGNSSASASGDQLPDCVALPELHQQAGSRQPCDLQDGLQTQSGFQAPAVLDPEAGLPIELGIGADGLPITFDLVADGPHALVAGTTGAGKSEFLQTLVLGLANRYSPDQVAIALVDYKGGAGFSHCSKLPHVVGMVTDLDPGSARRAIVGLRQQLKTRELLFDRHRVTSFPHFHQATDRQHVLPRVVIVVDELRALLDAEPAFIPDLMTLAAQGRSLGIHLVVATQRPSGVITAQMRANLNARLCLRVATPQDSVEVLESAVAAHLPHRLAGRAYLKVGGCNPVTLQTYYAGVLPQTPKVFRALQDPTTGELAPPVTPESLEPLLARVTRITGLWHATAAPAPLWAPDLPARFVFDPDIQQVPELFPVSNESLLVPLGIGETESSQTQALAYVNLSPTETQGGNLGIIGPSRSGHSTALATLMQGCVVTPEPHVAVHGVFTGTPFTTDYRGTHPALDRSQRIGTIAAHHEVRRITALFQILQSGGHLGPSILFLDDLPRLRTALESHHQGRGWDLLLDLFRSSAQLNLTIVFTSSSGMPTVLGPFVRQTLVFLTGKSPDDQFLGVPRTWAGTGRVPGRAVLLSGAPPHLVQVAASYSPSFNAALDVPPPEPISYAALPAQVPQLPTSFPGANNVLGTSMGAVSPDQPAKLEEVLVPLTGSWMIAGTPGSGRSTAGQRFVRAHLGAGTLLGAFGARPTGLFKPFEELDGFLASVTAQSETGDDQGLGGHMLGRPHTVVLDDVDELHAHNPQTVQRVIDLVLQHGYGLVVTALTSSLSQPRALPLKLGQLSQGIALMPTVRSDFLFLGHTIDQYTDPAHLMPGGRIPGRGVLISGTRAQPIQIAQASTAEDKG